jgi:hypothetical protein
MAKGAFIRPSRVLSALRDLRRSAIDACSALEAVTVPFLG